MKLCQTSRKLFTYVSPAFLCGFISMVVLYLASNLSSVYWHRSWVRFALEIYLMVLTAIWLGTVFWFCERFVKAILKKEFIFVIGSGVVLSIFIALNVRSNIVENSAYVASRAGLSFSMSHDGFLWGFPLPWFYSGTCFPCDVWGAWTVNWFLAIGTAWLGGTLLKGVVQPQRLK